MTFALTGCGDEVTQLTLTNHCGYPLELVKWRDYSFDNGQVWDAELGEYCYAMLNGSSVTKNVTPGTDYIWFYCVNDNYHYRTSNSISVHSGQRLSVEFPPGFLSSSGVLKSQIIDPINTKKQELLKLNGIKGD